VFQVFQAFQTYVSSVSTRCYKSRSAMLHILQWQCTHVASLYFKFFRCFRRTFQVFYLDVAYVSLALQAYISSVSFVSYLCCKCFI
jgi:hypothetical protein